MTQLSPDMRCRWERAILVTNNTREFEQVLEDWVNLLQTNVSFVPGS